MSLGNIFLVHKKAPHIHKYMRGDNIPRFHPYE